MNITIIIIFKKKLVRQLLWTAKVLPVYKKLKLFSCLLTATSYELTFKRRRKNQNISLYLGFSLDQVKIFFLLEINPQAFLFDCVFKNGSKNCYIPTYKRLDSQMSSNMRLQRCIRSERSPTSFACVPKKQIYNSF